MTGPVPRRGGLLQTPHSSVINWGCGEGQREYYKDACACACASACGFHISRIDRLDVCGAGRRGAARGDGWGRRRRRPRSENHTRRATPDTAHRPRNELHVLPPPRRIHTKKYTPNEHTNSKGLASANCPPNSSSARRTEQRGAPRTRTRDARPPQAGLGRRHTREVYTWRPTHRIPHAARAPHAYGNLTRTSLTKKRWRPGSCVVNGRPGACVAGGMEPWGRKSGASGEKR